MTPRPRGRPTIPAEDRRAASITTNMMAAELAAIDAVRGTLTRSMWVRMVAVAAATKIVRAQ